MHFRLHNGCVGVLESVASDRGPMLFVTRVAGTLGTAWAEGDRVRSRRRRRDSRHRRPARSRRRTAATRRPPTCLHSAYDLLHSTGIEVGPYVRLAQRFLARIEGSTEPMDPAPATFADGVATMKVLDAIRRSAREGRSVDLLAMTGVVVAGTGFGCVTHVRALKAAGFEVLALVGRDPERTAQRAAAVGVPRAGTSFTEALSLPGVDAATIATPPHTHAELVLEAVHAGKHVLCEKPFARDSVEARTLLDAAERAGIVHLLGTEFRYDTGQAVLARAVRDGVVGEPRLALFVLHVPVLADAGAALPDWWADAEQGGGWLGAHGSQVIDQIRVTLGEFADVTTSLVRIARTTTADDGFVVHFRLESGVAGVMQSTAADRGPFLIETRVIGTRGTAWIDGLGDDVWVADADGTRQLPIADDLRTPPASAPPRSPPHDHVRADDRPRPRPRSVHTPRRALPRAHHRRRAAARSRARDVRRRRRRHGGARRNAPVRGRKPDRRHLGQLRSIRSRSDAAAPVLCRCGEPFRVRVSYRLPVGGKVVGGIASRDDEASLLDDGGESCSQPCGLERVLEKFQRFQEIDANTWLRGGSTTRLVEREAYEVVVSGLLQRERADGPCRRFVRAGVGRAEALRRGLRSCERSHLARSWDR